MLGRLTNALKVQRRHRSHRRVQLPKLLLVRRPALGEVAPRVGVVRPRFIAHSSPGRIAVLPLRVEFLFELAPSRFCLAFELFSLVDCVDSRERTEEITAFIMNPTMKILFLYTFHRKMYPTVDLADGQRKTYLSK